VARRDNDPDFIEAIARGLDVLTAFSPGQQVMTLSDIAARTELARPTVRRILVTLEALGHIRSVSGGFMLTPRVLELGLTYVSSMGLWDVAKPHLERLVERTHESSSIAQLDGSDIVYVARVAVPKIIALAVQIGTRFPAPPTSLGKVLLADLRADELENVLAQPGRSGITPRHPLQRDELDRVLRDVRAKGWAATVEGRVGPRDRRHERHRARRGDLDGDASRRLPPAAAADRVRGERGVRTDGPGAQPHGCRRLLTAGSTPS
jgi:IclR family pca regulon transcriptional regulator